MNLKPVVTSLFLMGLACGSAMAEGQNGDDLMTAVDTVDAVDATVDVSDVVEQDAGVVTGAVSPQVTISGKVNADYSHRDFGHNSAYPYLDMTALIQDQEVKKTEESDGRLAGNVQLNIDAELGDNNAHVGLLYSLDGNNGSTISNNGDDTAKGKTNPGQFDVAEAYVRMLNLGGTPVTLKFGHGFTDFGKSGADQGDFERYPVVRSLTQSLSQTTANYLQLGMSDIGLQGFHVSGYVLDHKNANDIGDPFGKKDKDGNSHRLEDKIGTYGVNLGYNFFTNFLSQEQWGLNFSYVTNPGAVETVEAVQLNSAKNGALAVSGHVIIDDAELDLAFVKYGKIYDKEGNSNDRRTLKGDSISTDGVQVAPTALFSGAVNEDDAPSAFDVSGSYSFRDTFGAGADTKLSFGYGHGQDSVRLFLPQSQFNFSASQGLGSGADLTLAYAIQKNYDKKDAEGNAYKDDDDKEFKGASNNILSLRLSYNF